MIAMIAGTLLQNVEIDSEKDKSKIIDQSKMRKSKKKQAMKIKQNYE